MDRYSAAPVDDEDEERKSQIIEFDDEPEEEEEMGEEEEESYGVPSSILLTRLKETIIEAPENPYRELDDRRRDVQERIRLKMKAATKTLVQKAAEKKEGIERQLEDTDKQLTELLSFGDELVSNIKIANEMREYSRRELENHRKDILSQDLKRESIEALARYDLITAQWSELGEMKEPMSLFEEMEKQREKISELMQNKDDIIAKCQAELDRISEKYYLDQEKQMNDVSCLVERVDNQLELIKSAYKEHKNLLLDTIESERQRIGLADSMKWEEFYNLMNAEETRKIDIVHDKEDFYSEDLERIRADQEQITRATRIRLDKDAEMLEWELRNVRNNVMMNSEKFEYNYQVLQKRIGENVIINNQQKRRVSRLIQNIALMRRKCAQATIDSENLLRKMSRDIQKLHASISETEKKTQYFKLNNKKKFDQIWDINFKQLKTNMSKAFEIDRILTEQQLAMPWTHPEVDYTDINQSEPSESGGQKKAAPKEESPKDAKTKTEGNRQAETRLLRNIIRKIADRGGFLVEDKLMKLLQPYGGEATSLVRLDNIFAALQIREIKEIASLTPYFERYAYCPNCSQGPPTEALQDFFSPPKESAEEPKAETATSPQSIKSSSKPWKKEVQGAPTVPKCMKHYLVIEPAMVMTSLNDFTAARIQKSAALSAGINEAQENAINLIKPTEEEIESFWKKFVIYMPEKKLKLWTALEHGLNHYVDVLKRRKKLDEECEFLKKQNLELSHLLQKFQV